MAEEQLEDLAGTYGSLLLGALVSACLTGVVTVQTLLYYKLFPYDKLTSKVLVAVVSLLDLAHSAMVWIGIWVHLISRPRTLEHSDFIPLIVVTVGIISPAFLTFLVHMFFAERIHRRTSIKTLTLLPLGHYISNSETIVSAGKWIRLQSFAEFVEVSSWSFTLGLALSSAVDIIVTLSLFVLLRDTVGPDTLRLGRIIDSLVLYTVEIGTMTWPEHPKFRYILNLNSIIQWLTMRHNLIFLGLHFIIGKLYANSLLAT
ncbi:hypothetical protein FA15DRAFT_602900 [Coprinopsis marcescibilis]|uniref:DUF6534 domain-containing protein n=1 Tax=Coprinopsis marcescibilis TaxID=230819 RepID=A0A5C3KSA7_COPMA|nr:hypothetical protein FA15DRAFT_602900 [Coprinopsis marcescibilis]